MSDAVDRAADELYGLPLAEFVPRRDELTRELRAAGDGGAAAAVKRMPKPSAPAWAVNRLARERPDEVAELLRAGDELRRVQEWLLRGEADPADLRSAVEAERTAVGRLVREAAGVLEAVGRPARGDVLERIGETLHAAAADPDVRADVERGRLVRDRAAVGLGPTVPAGATRRAGKRARAASPKAGHDENAAEAAREELRAAEAEARAAERMQAAADKAVERATRALGAAEANWEAAREELRAAREELGAAQRAAESAREAAEAAAAEADRLRGD